MEQDNSSAKLQGGHARRHVSIDAVINEFGALFLDGRFCNIYFLDDVHGRGPHCPECGKYLDESQADQYYSLQRFTCKKCGSQSNAKKGTILEGSKASPRQYILFAYLLGLPLSLKDIAIRVGVSGETIRKWKGIVNV